MKSGAERVRNQAAAICARFRREESQCAILFINIERSKRRLPRTEHSQTVMTRQPVDVSLTRFFSSFIRFVWIFRRQNAALVLGHWNKGHSCPCQRQPCTKMTARYFGNTRSGHPGKARRWSRYRNPRANKPFRIVYSGLVFLPGMRDMQ
jgi:hypothetical protein